MVWQPSLLGAASPRCDPTFRGVEHRDLGSGAWLELAPRWVDGADTLVTIPYSRIRHHRQYAAPNQDGFTVTVLPPRS